jgi:hypothetical protein
MSHYKASAWKGSFHMDRFKSADLLNMQRKYGAIHLMFNVKTVSMHYHQIKGPSGSKIGYQMELDRNNNKKAACIIDAQLFLQFKRFYYIVLQSVCYVMLCLSDLHL